MTTKQENQWDLGKVYFVHEVTIPKNLWYISIGTSRPLACLLTPFDHLCGSAVAIVEATVRNNLKSASINRPIQRSTVVNSSSYHKVDSSHMVATLDDPQCRGYIERVWYIAARIAGTKYGLRLDLVEHACDVTAPATDLSVRTTHVASDVCLVLTIYHFRFRTRKPKGR